jgi:hypothetical protein
MTNKIACRRPLYQVMVKAIHDSTPDNVLCLMDIVREAPIEPGHEEEVIQAMEQKWNCWPHWCALIEEIKQILLAQKTTH